MDTSADLAMCLHKKNGNIMRFVEHINGLYYYDTKRNGVSRNTTCLVQSVAESKKVLVKREVDAADIACDLYQKMGLPSHDKFEEIIVKNIIRNCPITIDDARRALTIYGLDVASIKGKTVRGKPVAHVMGHKPVSLPTSITDFHLDVTLCMDFFYVQGQVFLHIISRKIQHRIVNAVSDRSKKHFLKHLDNALRLYI
jgi:hypothetical protein